jgi:septum formation protein
VNVKVPKDGFLKAEKPSKSLLSMPTITATSSLILASQSRYRRELLERLKIPFSCQSPFINETELKDQFWARSKNPHALALSLAIAKAESVATLHPDSWVLGSDQLLSLDGEILGKAPSRREAIEQLTKLSGRRHDLITAWALMKCGKPSSDPKLHSSVHVSSIELRHLRPDEIERYVDLEKPFDCAGSYKLESLGISLVESIQSTDFTSIIGLPLLEVSRLLREIGFNIP